MDPRFCELAYVDSQARMRDHATYDYDLLGECRGLHVRVEPGGRMNKRGQSYDEAEYERRLGHPLANQNMRSRSPAACHFLSPTFFLSFGPLSMHDSLKLVPSVSRLDGGQFNCSIEYSIDFSIGF